MQRLMQGLCNVPRDKRSHFAGLCKECKDGNHPKEEMKKAILYGFDKDSFQKSREKVAFLADPCQGHVKARLRYLTECKGQQRNTSSPWSEVMR